MITSCGSRERFKAFSPTTFEQHSHKRHVKRENIRLTEERTLGLFMSFFFLLFVFFPFFCELRT